jgi:uncharacterized protein with NRDE domain
LVTEFLTNESTPEEFVHSLAKGLVAPSPFNLIVGSVSGNLLKAYWLGGRTREISALHDGIHTLSNAELNTPWPKAKALHQALQNMDHADGVDLLTKIMRQTQLAQDHELPSTGVPLDWEKRLSAIHITGERYHTRSTTLLSLSDRKVSAKEFTWGPEGQLVNTVDEAFELL